MQRRYNQTESDWMREEIERYMATRPLPDLPRPETAARDPRCHGELIEALSKRRACPCMRLARGLIRSTSTLRRATARVLTNREYLIARQILKEITERLGSWWTWDSITSRWNAARNTLSGGEAQRIRLADPDRSSLMVCALHPRRAEYRACTSAIMPD